MQQLEARTKLPKSYLAAGAFAFYLILIFINVGGIGEILANIVGFVIPTYLSLIALRTKTSEDDTQLLTYWIVFSFLNVIEFWSKTILYMIPFYWFLKTIFVLYIALPQTGGASLIYRTFISPVADKYIVKAKKSDDIKDAVHGAASKASGSSIHN